MMAFSENGSITEKVKIFSSKNYYIKIISKYENKMILTKRLKNISIQGVSKEPTPGQFFLKKLDKAVFWQHNQAVPGLRILQAKGTKKNL